MISDLATKSLKEVTGITKTTSFFQGGGEGGGRENLHVISDCCMGSDVKSYLRFVSYLTNFKLVFPTFLVHVFRQYCHLPHFQLT